MEQGNIQQVLSHDIASLILKTPLVKQMVEDKVDLKSREKRDVLGQKCLSFMCRGCLPTQVRLQDKGVQYPLSSVTCDDSSEELTHVFFAYSFVV